MFAQRWCPRCLLAVGALCGIVASSAGIAAEGGNETATESAPSHPQIPGFERFLAGSPAETVRGGRLLLGELNCTACHRADDAVAARILGKQAPILDTVGNRVKPGFLRAFLNDPHQAKPGTTMPNLFSGLSEAERKEKVEALVHFLASTGGVSETAPSRRLIGRGRKVFQQVGCVACHGPLEGPEPRMADSVPLGDLSSKYTIASLSAFLLDPSKVRPSGRMPGLNLTGNEANDLAHYLLRALQVEERPNLSYQYFEGSWSELPDLDTLKPVSSGRVVGFDLTLARRPNEFALKFEGDLKVERSGRYRFHLTSDDGSKLWIDGTLVVDNDGTHPAETASEGTHLDKGTHRLTLAYFNGGGEQELELEYEGGGLPRQPVSSALSPVGPPPAPREAEAKPNSGHPSDQGPFQVDRELAGKGRTLFASTGCASCHQLRENKTPIASTLTADPLARLKIEGGCLEAAHQQGGSMYRLSDPQRKALTEALRSLANPTAGPPSARETVAQTLTAFNCYACHQRDGLGGVEEARDRFFETTQKEMGDEGRLPPHLNGVGGKLTSSYLKQIVANGSKDRPYMLTRMPGFGEANVGPLVSAIEAIDTVEPVETTEFNLPVRRVKSTGRFLAGGEALGCIKCHTFKGIQAEGVQAIDMTIMTHRLRRDWFHRYLLDPQAFRPGTRMPGAWPMGKSLLPKVLDGDTRKQIESLWLFLSDGSNAAEPYGLGRDPIPLVADKEAVVYRNFLQGAGPRAIGVGYPEKANLAFDANEMRIAMIWQGAFIDASRHWSGRGEGFQPPLGDNVIALPGGPPFAILKSGTDAWPKAPSRSLGYVFRGYQLGKDQKPTFRYDFGPVHVEDFPDAIKGTGAEVASLRRTLTLSASEPVDNLWFRSLAADKIEPGPDGWFTINGEWKMRIKAESAPVVRTSGGKAELLVPVDLHGKPAEIIQEFNW